MAGSTLHLVHFTVYIRHCTCTFKCPWIWTCILHNTHWTLYTAHHMFILYFSNVSLQNANIQKFPVLVSWFTWQNVSWQKKKWVYCQALRMFGGCHVDLRAIFKVFIICFQCCDLPMLHWWWHFKELFYNGFSKRC